MKIQTIMAWGCLFILLGCTAKPQVDVPEKLHDLENLEAFSSENQPDSELTLSREVTYGDTGDVLLGGRINRVEIDGEGRVYIADPEANTVHVFNSDGTFGRDVGRRGEGPGEFQSVTDIAIGNGLLHVLDINQYKISTYSLNTHAHEEDISIALDNDSGSKPPWLDDMGDKNQFYRPHDFFVRNDGMYLLLYSDQRISLMPDDTVRTYQGTLFDPSEKRFLDRELFSFDWTGGVLLHMGGGGMLVMRGVPYKRTSRFDFENELFVYGWTDDLLFKYYGGDGNYRRAVYYDQPAVELNLDDVLAMYESDNSKEAIRNDEDFPESWPAFGDLELDDQNRLWVATHTGNPDEYEWWVLDEQGERLGTFTWPDGHKLAEVKNGYVYALETAEDGTKEVARYAVEGLGS